MVSTPKIRTTMALVPSGSFEMGSDAGGEFEGPMHEAFLERFWIDQAPVNNREFAQFASETGYRTGPEICGSAWGYHNGVFGVIPGLNWRTYADIGREDHPVVLVSWHDANAYAHWAGKRLPTEAQWEKAARGGLPNRLYPWGDKEPDGTQCNFARRPAAVPPTTPSGTFAPNPYGIYDITGNVWQWCADSFNPHAYSTSSIPSNVDCLELDATLKARRGGGWNVIQPFRLRCANRGALPFSAAAPNLGFRCCSMENLTR